MSPELLLDNRSYLTDLTTRLRLAALRLVGSASAVDDHVQNALVKFIEKLPSGKVNLSGPDDEVLHRATSYAIGILRNVVRGARRDMARNMVLSMAMLGDKQEQVLEPSTSKDDTVERVLFRERLQAAKVALAAAAADLPPALRQLFDYDRANPGASANSAAIALGIKESNVRKIRERYRKFLANHPKIRSVADAFNSVVYSDHALGHSAQAIGACANNQIVAMLIRAIRAATASPAEFVARLGANAAQAEAVLRNYKRMTNADS